MGRKRSQQMTNHVDVMARQRLRVATRLAFLKVRHLPDLARVALHGFEAGGAGDRSHPLGIDRDTQVLG